MGSFGSLISLFFLTSQAIGQENTPLVFEGSTGTCCSVRNVQGSNFENAATLAGFYYKAAEESTPPDPLCVDGCVYRKLVDTGDNYYCFKNYTAAIIPNITCIDKEGYTAVGFDALTVNTTKLREILTVAGADATFINNTIFIVTTLQYWHKNGLAALEANVLPLYNITLDYYKNFLAYYGYNIDLTTIPRVKRQERQPVTISCGALDHVQTWVDGQGHENDEGQISGVLPSRKLIEHLKAHCKNEGLDRISLEDVDASLLPRVRLDLEPEVYCSQVIATVQLLEGKTTPEESFLHGLRQTCEERRAVGLSV